ncbi:MAG: ribosome assembly RNA-binding protein YhbY [Clostridiaceae bacterium]
MLTSKQRSYLRSLANTVEPIFQVGKGGIGDNLIRQFNDALEARELVKATVLKNAEADVRGICEEIAEQTGAEVVQVIGSKFVLYRESVKHKEIEL